MKRPSVRNSWGIIKAGVQGYLSLCGHEMLDRNPGRLTQKTLKKTVLERVPQLYKACYHAASIAADS